MRRIDVTERRARLAVRHHLAPVAWLGDPVAAAADAVGLHASDPMTVYLAMLARTDGVDRERLTDVLYGERALLRVVGPRATMFVVPRDLAGVMTAACAQPAAARERARLARWIGEAGVADDPGAWLEAVEAEANRALGAPGAPDGLTASELVRLVPRLRAQLPFGEGRTWQGSVGVVTRILFLLAAQGRVVRGRPKGTIVSSLYRWVPMDRWVEGGLAVPRAADARVDLVRRWLAAYGPGTLGDLRWWSGWPLRDVREALRGLDTVEVEVAGQTGLVLAGDDAAGPTTPDPWAALLPSLDPCVMAWADRDWFIGPHRAALFDRNGNAGPTAWWDGRVVGGWAQRRDGEVVVRLLEDAGREAASALDAAAERVLAWLGPVRVVPRFRTPLEAELVR